ncbi:hypothetical protein NC652_028698 [Populus alba x Populus x berolinensis]|nr:hypothetical protein NC652_028698 [Populus alba x Populus x berolinensis]
MAEVLSGSAVRERNYPGFHGGGAKDCEEGFEVSEGKGK